jgi:uncharacterized protein (TIGR03435 family)
MVGSRVIKRRPTGALATIVLCFACLLIPVQGQDHESFDAAVIKRADPRVLTSVGLKVDPRYLFANSVTLRYLIIQAFAVEDYRLAGIGGWMESERYSIAATSGRAVDRTQMLTMLRDLLAVRFHLKMHHENREIPVFALVVDKRGPKLPPLREGEDDSKFFQSSGERMTRSIGSTIQDLIRHLNSRTGPAALGRPVIDRTGLNGLYRIRLTFQVETNPDGKSGRFDVDYPSALASQLGLRLEPTKATIDFLVIDNAARPSLDE